MQREVTFGTVKQLSILKLRSRCSQHRICSKTIQTTIVTAEQREFGLTKTAVYILLVLGLVLRTVRPRQWGRCHEPETKQREPLKLAWVARNRGGTSKSGWSRSIAIWIFQITDGAVCTQRARVIASITSTSSLDVS